MLLLLQLSALAQVSTGIHVTDAAVTQAASHTEPSARAVSDVLGADSVSESPAPLYGIKIVGGITPNTKFYLVSNLHMNRVLRVNTDGSSAHPMRVVLSR